MALALLTLVFKAIASDGLMAAASNTVSSVRSDPLRLKTETRVVVDTNAAPTAGSATNAPKKSFRVNAAWHGWDGLSLELDEHMPVSNPTNLLGGYLAGTNSLAPIHLEQVKMTARIGGRFEVDGAGFVTTDDLTGFDGGVQLRRALINAQGDCILILPVSYLVELGYIPNQFYLNQAYLLSPKLDYLGNLQFGVYGPPMGLDLTTSSRDLTFMEPAAPLQAIAPGNMLGLQIGQPVFHQRATWALGFFGDASADTEYGNASQNFGSAIGRVTWLALAHLNETDPAANHLLHLGLSADFQYSASSEVRYRSRPESYLAPYVIDTGSIAASQAMALAAEVAYVKGPLTLQGEFIHSWVQPNSGDTLNFGGCYAYAGWYLTGESRPYDPCAGDFKRLIPRHNFNWGKGGAWGAFELAARISHTDLTDRDVQGGRLNLLMAGVNWYLHPHVKWMFNYGMGRVSGGPPNGDLFIFQTRVGIDF